MRLKKYIITGAVALVVIIIIATLSAAIKTANTPVQLPGQHPVVVSVLPKSADITISGSDTKLTNGHINYLEPGEYTVKVEAKDHASEEVSFTVKEGLRPKVITALPVVGDGQAGYTDRDLLEIERASGQASREYADLYEKKYPAKKMLPYKDPYYQIGYSSTDGVDFFITVHTESPRYREQALKKILSMGISPSRYKIVFKDYEFPLQEAN